MLEAAIEGGLRPWQISVKGTPWLTDQPKHAKQYLKSTIIPEKKPHLILPDSESNYDFENAVQIHECYQLTPVQASDPRLWARLTHVETWDYMPVGLAG